MLPVGAVVIGRNEGERLVRCLRSLGDQLARVVYVDSDSTDDSRERAAKLGAIVESLDPAIPFTAARARNAGLARLRAIGPEIPYVFFVDGDCEVVRGWLAAAVSFLEEHPAYAAVCGRRRERHPEQSIYNRLTDLEWDTPIGDASACGGDALYRVRAFEQVGGFRSDLIAGEEPELGLRLRREGYRIHRMDADMTLHDASIASMAQWWRRRIRAGHACAEAVYLHGRGPERFFVRRWISMVAWGGAVPGIELAGILVYGAPGLLLLGLHAALLVRIFRGRRRAGDDRRLAWLHAAGLVAGKAPEFQGVVRFVVNRFVRRRRTALIEYK